MNATTKRRGWTSRVLATLLIVGTLPILLAGVSVAAPPPPTPSSTTAIESADYFSENWADPLDYANGEDINLIPFTPPATGTVDADVANPNLNTGAGMLDFDTDNSHGNWVTLIHSNSGTIPWGRDAKLHPIDTSKYTWVSFRMFANGSAAGGVSWFTCDTGTPNCQGLKPFLVQPGWQTYYLPMQRVLGAEDWVGNALAVRLDLPSNIHYTLDWARLYQPSPGINVTIPQNATEVWWDTDTNPANNGVPGNQQAGAGTLATGSIGAGASINFPIDQFPGGTYYIYYVSGGQVSTYSAPIVNDRRPEPVVVSPDVSGGEDYASAVRGGDSWDMSQPSDIAFSANTTLNVGGGLASGTNAGPNPGDSQIFLSHPPDIPATLFHHVSVRVGYSGTFAMTGSPGGGMNGRFLWTPGSYPFAQETQDFVVYPGWETISFDLKTNPPSAINDENTANPKGWGGPESQTTTAFRFDPDEDPGARSWSVDYITLTRNARGTPTYDVKYKDNAWKPGTTADIFVDNDPNGYNGTKIASGVSVGAGTNTFNWNGTDYLGNLVGAGTFWVFVVLHDPAGATNHAYAGSELDMPTQPGNPPSVPGAVSAVAGVESANLSWSAPASNGGFPLTGYVITVSPGGGQLVVPPGATTAKVTGLTGGTPYTFTVAARNAIGTGPATASSNTVTPSALPGVGFHPVVPYRALDSRTAVGGWGGVPLGQAAPRDLVVAPSGGAGGVPASATAVVMNVTVTGGTNGSYLTAFPSGAAVPNAANLNFSPNQTVPNLVTAKIGNGGAVSFFNAVGNVHVVADVVGYFDDGSVSGDLFNGVPPVRLLDSRTTTGGWNNTKLAQNSTNDLLVVGGSVPATATAVVMNVTVTGGTQDSYLQAYPKGAAQPLTANVLFGTGQTVPNLVTVGVGTGGQVTFYNQLGSVHVIADLVGYFDPTAGGGKFHSTTPTRILDSRDGTGGYNTPWGTNTTRALGVGGAAAIPPTATGTVMNVTATNTSMNSFLTVFPDGGANPGTANLLFGKSKTIPNLVMVGLPVNGQVDMYNQQGSADVIADVAGYFALT